MKYIQSFLLSVVTFFLPIQGLLIAVGAAVALDTITGVYKARKLSQPIISKRMRDIVPKIIAYDGAVLGVYLMDHFLLSEFFKMWFSVDLFFTKIVSLMLIFIELVSIKENIEAAKNINLIEKIRAAIKGTKEIKDQITDLTK